MVYQFETPLFGRILVTASSLEEAKAFRSRFKAAGKVTLVQRYRHCDKCDSKPCCCERKAS